jgi:hypothetical protein
VPAGDRSKNRIVQAALDVKSWLARPPTVDEVRPGRCPACDAPSRPAGGLLGLHGHGLRERHQWGPLEPSATPSLSGILLRRYLCQSCGAVVVVVPRALVRRRLYSAGAIALALAALRRRGARAGRGPQPREPAPVRGPHRGGGLGELASVVERSARPDAVPGRPRAAGRRDPAAGGGSRRDDARCVRAGVGRALHRVGRVPRGEHVARRPSSRRRGRSRSHQRGDLRAVPAAGHCSSLVLATPGEAMTRSRDGRVHLGGAAADPEDRAARAEGPRRGRRDLPQRDRRRAHPQGARPRRVARRLPLAVAGALPPAWHRDDAAVLGRDARALVLRLPGRRARRAPARRAQRPRPRSGAHSRATPAPARHP